MHVCVRLSVRQSVNSSLRAYDARNTKRTIDRTTASACVRACFPSASCCLRLVLAHYRSSSSLALSLSDSASDTYDFLVCARPPFLATTAPEEFMMPRRHRHLSTVAPHIAINAVFTITIQRGCGGGDGGGGGGGGGGGSGGSGGGSSDKRRRVATQCHLLDSRESSGWSVVERERCARMSERAV